MKTILTSNLKHKKIYFWVYFQILGLLFVLGWILSWLLAPQILWLDLLFFILSILQIAWTIVEIIYNRFGKREKRWSFLVNSHKYSWIEIVCNWIILLWPIIFLAFYIPIIAVYWQPLYNWVERKTLLWPLPDWTMYLIACMLLLMIMVWVTKFSQMYYRKSPRKTYKTIEIRRKEKLKKATIGTYDGTFGGVKKKAPKGFN